MSLPYYAYCDEKLRPYAEQIVKEIEARDPNHRIESIKLTTPYNLLYHDGCDVYQCFSDSTGMFRISICGPKLQGYSFYLKVFVAYTEKGKILKDMEG